MVTRTKTARYPASDIARICLDTTALCDVPLTLPVSKPGTATLNAEQPGQLAITTECPATQLLVVGERYHSGWQATIDDVPQEVYRVNGDFMGCVVGPGKHHVVLVFEPKSLQYGWILSCFGLGALGLCFIGYMPSEKSQPARHNRP
jgi:hypothetical protein